jgi:hypothetical protein
MLYLRIAELTDWTDSHGVRRSAFEEFPMLDPGSMNALVEANAGTWTAWQVGLLGDFWDSPDSSKQGELTGIPHPVAAIGSEHARSIAHDTMGSWQVLLRWLMGAGVRNVFVRDEVWSPNHEWVSIGRAIDDGLLATGGLSIAATRRPMEFCAHGTTEQLFDLLREWWPSAIGRLWGYRARHDVDVELDRRICASAAVGRADLEGLSRLFTTSDAMDNLGFSILSRGTSLMAIEAELQTLGLRNGIAIEP